MFAPIQKQASRATALAGAGARSRTLKPAIGNQAMLGRLQAQASLRHSEHSGRNGSRLAAPERPEVVVEPKIALETPAFAANPFLIDVIRGKKLLSFGATGEHVRLVQEALQASEIRKPSDPATRLPKFGVDGVFGPETKVAVEQFQSEYGLAVDGIVGQQTLHWLDETFKSYDDRPGPKAGNKLPGRFPGELPPTLQKPSNFDLTMKVDSPVTADTLVHPRITAKVSFKATFSSPDTKVAGPEGSVPVTQGKVFYVQNVRRVERKIHWQRISDCSGTCEQARSFVGKAQGLDTSLPYNKVPITVTSEQQTLETDDQPAHEAHKEFDPKGDFQSGDVVDLFAHDQFRMFFAFGPATPLFDFSKFGPLAFVDWEWRGKAQFTFDGSDWKAGSVERRIDPKVSQSDRSNELIFLGPLYKGEEIDRNLGNEASKVNEKPTDW